MRSMELHDFCSTSRVVIVAGKGGVGKTTVTAALATAAARIGMSVLIVEVEGKSGLASSLGCAPLDYDEVEVRPGLRARTLTPDHALLEYLEDRGLRRVSKRLLRSGALDVVATAVPGMKDILVLGKIKQLERAGAADLVLVDAPAAGHAISFLLSPRGLLDAVRVGAVRRQAEEVVELLSDPARCRVMLVTLPEETPVNELVDTAFVLEDRIGIKLAPVVVNAVPGDLALDGTDAEADAAALGFEPAPGEAGALDAAARFRHERHALSLAQAYRLAERLPLPQLRLPFLFDEIGPRDIERLADELADGVDALPARAAS
jgi:anion-transporting  ArsA/GET3 family ATPase